MRIYNAKKSSLTIPLVGSNQKISVAPKSVSGDFMPNKELLSLLITTFDYDEIALIVSGPYEISMCSQVSGCCGFIVNSLDEAIEKFSSKNSQEIKTNTAVLQEEPKTESISKADALPEAEETQNAPETIVTMSEETKETPVKKTTIRRYRKKKTEE